jgi:NDP-sugar pyrophosphorylase family protein
VVDQTRKLLGTITDGDVRRGILRGIQLSDSVVKIMNAHPVIARQSDEKHAIFTLMRNKAIRQIPIINQLDQVCDIEFLDDILSTNKKQNAVVLMAGGLATRLRPLTNDCPKPMLEVGGKPILETIITSLIQYGFQKFYISVNYLASHIQDYFGDGSKWGIQILYLHEIDKMGTAGSLSLLPEGIRDPILVMNSDLLTKVDFNKLLEFHYEQEAVATMCVREFDYTIPYGTCKLENNYIVDVIEKPTHKFFINAGVYLLEPSTLRNIQNNTYLDMPNFFSALIKKNHAIAAFPIREYWLDIGQLSDFERARKEYHYVFEQA